MRKYILFLLCFIGLVHAAEPQLLFKQLYQDPRILQVTPQLALITGLRARLAQAHAKNDQNSQNALVQQILSRYQTVLNLYKQAYEDAHIPIDVRIPGPFLQILRNYFDTVLQSISWSAQKMKIEKPDQQHYADDINAFLKQLSDYDALVDGAVRSVYGDQLSVSIAQNYYIARRATITQPIFINILSNLSRLYTKVPSLDVAQNVYKQAQAYFVPNLQIPGYANASLVQKKYNQAMAAIWQADAEFAYKQIDLEKKSVQDNQTLMQHAITSYKNAGQLYRSTQNNTLGRKTDALIKKIEANKQLYSQLPAMSQTISKLLATPTASDKEQAIQMLNKMIRFYAEFKDGTLVKATQLLISQAKVLLSVTQGKTYLDSYLKAVAASSNAAYTIAAQSGLVVTDATQLNKAAAAYAKGYQQYLDYLKNVSSLSEPAITLPMQALTVAMSSIVQAQQLSAQGIESAKLLTLDGLNQAEQKFYEARLALVNADAQYQSASDQLAPYLPMYPALISNDPAMTYVKALNNYIGALYIDICKPIYTQDPATVLQYYASIASYGIDMSSAIAQIKSGVNFIDAARTAASDARSNSANPQNWVAQQGIQGYSSVANTSWSKAMSLYETAISNGGDTQIASEYVNFLQEYTNQFLANVPQQYVPLLGALFIYHHAYMQYINQPNVQISTTLQTKIASLVQQAHNQLNQLFTQLEGLESQQNISSASSLETMITTYYTAIYPDTQLSALELSDTDITTAQVRLADAAKAIGANVLNSNYQQAYQQLSLARLMYQKAGRSDLADQETFKRQYFLAQTLSAASLIESQIVADGKQAIGSFTVPARYYLTEYVQPIPQGLPTQGDPSQIAKYIYVAYCLNDQNIDYAQVYNPGTTTMNSSLDADTKALAQKLEKAADNYVRQSSSMPSYTVQVVNQNGIPALKETNKVIPAIDAPYTNAPIAIGYYYSALMLYRPGTDLVTFQNQAFVPGQNDDKAWEMGYNIATTLLSSAATYSNQMNKQKAVFNTLKGQITELYNRLNAAQDYFNGKDHTDNFQGQSKFADQGHSVNLIIAQQLENGADIIIRMIKKDLSDDDLKAYSDEADKDYMVARQYYIDYYSPQSAGSADFTVDPANKIMVKVAQLYENVAKFFVLKEEYLYSVPYWGNASYQYQQLSDNNAKVNALAAKQQKVKEQLNEAYFKGAAQKGVAFAQTILAPTVVDNLSFIQLLDKRNNAQTSGASLTEQEFQTYNDIDGMILDALTYYLMANDEYGKLVSASNQDDTNKQANEIVNDFIVKHGFQLNQLASLRLQSIAIPGFNQFKAITDADKRNACLSTWAFQLYNSLSQIYITYYLPHVPADQQLPQLNDRITARLQSVTFGS